LLQCVILLQSNSISGEQQLILTGIADKLFPMHMEQCTQTIPVPCLNSTDNIKAGCHLWI
jgi:hypothetical protein